MLSQINKSATRRALLKYYAVVLDVVSVAPTHLHSATAQSTLGRKKSYFKLSFLTVADGSTLRN